MNKRIRKKYQKRNYEKFDSIMKQLNLAGDDVAILSEDRILVFKHGKVSTYSNVIDEACGTYFCEYTAHVSSVRGCMVYDLKEMPNAEPLLDRLPARRH